MRRKTQRGLIAAIVGFGTVVSLAFAPASSSSAASDSSFTKSETLTRTHLVDGKDQEVDKRSFSVTVDNTQNLRDRQELNVSWSGAHPTGGLADDINSLLGAQQEYPVMVMQCRGAPDTLSPATCWTHTPFERAQTSYTSTFPSYRLDRYAIAADRKVSPGVPNPVPKDCVDYLGSAQHWISFIAASTKVYAGGPLGCGGLSPDSVLIDNALQPSNTAYGQTGSDGKGALRFVINNSQSNASLGCSSTVACSLVIVPIMGISCDPAGASLPADDQPAAADRDQLLSACATKGNFEPGVANSQVNVEDLNVSGLLWWSASNWRNHIAVPLSFAQSSNVCDIGSTGNPTYIYGSQLMVPATEQWLPHFCLDPKLFNLRHVQTGEPQAKNLLKNATIEAAFVGMPPPEGYEKPVVHAPTAMTGFVLGYAIDDANGNPVRNVRLTPRLIAKLMTESYPGSTHVKSEYAPLKDNPIDIAHDPEYLALNPSARLAVSSEPASVLFSLSSDSDILRALTSYVNADPEARKWLDGAADPWGMTINPNYKGIKLPVESWPLLDTWPSPIDKDHPAPDLYQPSINPCLASDPVPYLPLIAAPVQSLATLTLNLQFGNANSQIACTNGGLPNQKLSAVGRQAPGYRFVIGITSFADSLRYQIDRAALQTEVRSGSGSKFTNGDGRIFVAPSTDSLKAAVKLFKADKKQGSWLFDYSAINSDEGEDAYPGSILISTDIPLSGLAKADASRYSQFLGFVAGSGQSQGFGNGQIPPGYLPLTAANGLGAQVSYTKQAATFVAAQAGVVPALDGSTKLPSGSGGGTSSGGGATTGADSSSGTGGDSNSGGDDGSLPTIDLPQSNSPDPGPPGPQIAQAPSGVTSLIRSGFGGKALPVIALLAIAGAIGGAASVLSFRRSE